jgi:hypothetical protein
MASLKIQLSRDSTICVSASEREGNVTKVVLIKEEIIYGGEKGILKKTQVALSVDEYNMFKLSLPAVDGVINYYACANHLHI